jgi:hypothetical protein
MAPEPRLTAGFWVRAYLRRLELAAIPAVLSARGDETAGAVLVRLTRLNGRAEALQRSFDPMTGNRLWTRLAEGEEREVDAVLARARSRDPDLWVVEIEDRHGRTLLDEDGLNG